MNTRNLMVWIVLFLGLLGCDETKLQPGEEGGECRIGPEACAEGLSCTDGSCQPTVEEEQRPELTIRFNIADRRIVADGVSNSPILIEAEDAENGEKFTGDLLLFPSPARAGRMDPPTIQFIDGLAQSAYVSCRAGGVNECPEFIFIYAAHPDRPLEPIARSPAIQLVDLSDEFENAITPAGCDNGEGRLSFQPDLSIGEETVFPFQVADLTFKPEDGIMNIQAGNSQIGLRFDSMDTSTGIRELQTQDIVVSPGSGVDLPGPCSDPAGNQWSGSLDVKNVIITEGVLTHVAVYFEASCTIDTGQTASLRGCANFAAMDN